MLSTSLFAQEEVPFTLEDRDRLIRLEAEQMVLRNEMNSLRSEMNSLRSEMNALRNEMNARFKSIENEFGTKLKSQQIQIDDLKIMFRWGFSILITLMLFILGYIIWDRRTALNPIRKMVEQDKIEVEKIKSVLKEMGESDQKIAEILKRTAMF
jgi:regulator of replication initiation timing